MTPKEKAKKLVIEFTFQRENHELYVAKQCALKCVNELLEATKKHIARKNYTVDTVYDSFWQEVKSEIEKL